MSICEKVLKKNEDTVYRVIEGEAILVKLDSINEEEEGKIFLLNETGTGIWNLINGKRRMEDIAHELCEEYAVDLEVAEDEVKKLIQLLSKKGLID